MPSDTTDGSDDDPDRTERGDAIPHARFAFWAAFEYSLPAALGTLLLGTGLWKLYAVVSGTLVDRTGRMNHPGYVLAAVVFVTLGWAFLVFALGGVAHRALADA